MLQRRCASRKFSSNIQKLLPSESAPFIPISAKIILSWGLNKNWIVWWIFKLQYYSTILLSFLFFPNFCILLHYTMSTFYTIMVYKRLVLCQTIICNTWVVQHILKRLWKERRFKACHCTFHELNMLQNKILNSQKGSIYTYCNERKLTLRKKQIL